MILGFAHVSIGCEFGVSFLVNYDVPSSPKKWPLLKNKPLHHDLVVGVPGLVPIELVNYDTGLVRCPGRIRIQRRGAIEVRSRNDEAEMSFLYPLGVKVGGLVRVGSHIKKWRVDIWVHRDEGSPIDPPLDIAGCCAIAFYSTDVDEDADRLMQAGGRDLTGKFFLYIGGKKMEVCMLRSPEGTIVELIKVCQREEKK